MLRNLMIISGGQTGADRAVLDWAIAHGIPRGGYQQRNKANVQDSDATLILTISQELSGGSKQTASFAKHLRKPWLHVYPEMNWQEAITSWLASTQIGILNVAGPRSSKEPDIGAFVINLKTVVSRPHPQDLRAIGCFAEARCWR